MTAEESLYNSSCQSLSDANYTVVVQLTASSLHYLIKEISYINTSFAEAVALRNVDAGYTIGVLSRALSWFVAFFMFGARPRDGTTSSTYYASSLYFHLILWVFIVMWERYHLLKKIRDNQIAVGEHEVDEGDTEASR